MTEQTEIGNASSAVVLSALLRCVERIAIIFWPRVRMAVTQGRSRKSVVLCPAGEAKARDAIRDQLVESGFEVVFEEFGGQRGSNAHSNPGSLARRVRRHAACIMIYERGMGCESLFEAIGRRSMRSTIVVCGRPDAAYPGCRFNYIALDKVVADRKLLASRLLHASLDRMSHYGKISDMLLTAMLSSVPLAGGVSYVIGGSAAYTLARNATSNTESFDSAQIQIPGEASCILRVNDGACHGPNETTVAMKAGLLRVRLRSVAFYDGIIRCSHPPGTLSLLEDEAEFVKKQRSGFFDGGDRDDWTTSLLADVRRLIPPLYHRPDVDKKPCVTTLVGLDLSGIPDEAMQRIKTRWGMTPKKGGNGTWFLILAHASIARDNTSVDDISYDSQPILNLCHASRAAKERMCEVVGLDDEVQ